MTQDDNTVDISRRQILAGLGTVGLASAASGLGTTAFFSDEESFEDNQLEAGRLDLLTDYRITYEGGPGRQDELNDLYKGSEYNLDEVELIDEEEGVYLLDQVPNGDYDGEEWVSGANNDEFGPDQLTDAGFPLFNLTDVKPGDYGEATISLHLFDNAGYVWMGGSLERNAQNGIMDPERETLEGSDDYVSTDTDDRGLFEDPNSDGEVYYFDPESDGAPDEDDWGGQLADSIEARAWYDANCNNVFDGTQGEAVDIVLVMDASGSMDFDDEDGEETTRMEDAREAAHGLADELRTDVAGSGEDDRLGIVEFASYDDQVLGLTDAGDHSDIEDVIDDLDVIEDEAATNYAAGLYAGRKVLEDDDEGREQIMIVLGDGAPTATYDASGEDMIGDHNLPTYDVWEGWDQSDKLDAIDSTNGSFDQDSQDDAIDAADAVKDETDITIATIGLRLDQSDETANAEDTLTDIASEDEDEETVLFYESPTDTNLEAIFQQVGEAIFLGETVIAEGTLREVLDELSGGVQLDPERLDEEEGESCFQPDLTYCIGFEWELPAEVGNEVQSDVVEFDIDFLAQQCRHNDEPSNPYAD